MRARTCWLPVVLILAACGEQTTPVGNSGGNAAAPVAQAAANVKAADEAAALDAISKINDAQSNYFKRNRRYALTLDELGDARLIKVIPTSSQTGYDFTLRPAADAQTYTMSANPVNVPSSARHFFTDQSGAVRAKNGKDATADSPKI
jgi:hypothetical protein